MLNLSLVHIIILYRLENSSLFILYNTFIFCYNPVNVQSRATLIVQGGRKRRGGVHHIYIYIYTKSIIFIFILIHLLVHFQFSQLSRLSQPIHTTIFATYSSILQYFVINIFLHARTILLYNISTPFAILLTCSL